MEGFVVLGVWNQRIAPVKLSCQSETPNRSVENEASDDIPSTALNIFEVCGFVFRLNDEIVTSARFV